jgi:hypothetical protein
MKSILYDLIMVIQLDFWIFMGIAFPSISQIEQFSFYYFYPFLKSLTLL